MQLNAETVALIGTGLAAVAAVGTLVVNAATGKFAATKGEREVAVDEREAVVAERQQAIVEAQATTGLLREQVEILRQHRDEREAEIKVERELWRERETKLDKRIDTFEERIAVAEKNYATLVLSITEMGLCALAATCPQYNAGDRRTAEVPGSGK